LTGRSVSPVGSLLTASHAVSSVVFCLQVVFFWVHNRPLLLLLILLIEGDPRASGIGSMIIRSADTTSVLLLLLKLLLLLLLLLLAIVVLVVTPSLASVAVTIINNTLPLSVPVSVSVSITIITQIAVRGSVMSNWL
jgi:hypothetical protein